MKKKTGLKKLRSTVLLTSLALMTAVPTFASAQVSTTNITPVNQQSFKSVQSNAQFDATIKTANTFGPYVKVNNKGQLYLTKKAKQIGVSQAEYDQFLKGLQLENDAISQGYLKIQSDKHGDVTKIEATAKLTDALKESYKTYANQQTPTTGIHANASAGFHWWGFGITLTESETTAFIKALGVGSGAAWLAAELSAAGYITLPASVPAGLIAAVCALGGAVIYAADNGSGVTVGVAWNGLPVLYGN
jgi:hypothetical protein